MKHDENRISWDEHHMQLAMVSSRRSPDPNTKVGACIVDELNRPRSLGYNGTPRKLSPHKIPWKREASKLADTKYPWIVHAERNAIDNRPCDVDGMIMYVTMHPCHECAKGIIQAGIKEIVYWKNPYATSESVMIAKKMFDLVDMKVRMYVPKYIPEEEKEK